MSAAAGLQARDPMNVLFLSPAFPPNAYLFCTALASRGVTVLGIGDSPPHDVRPELWGALREYVHVPSLADYDSVYRATAGLIARHGRLHRLDMQIELWLDLSGRLRDDFNVPGLRAGTLALQRRKSGMATLFDAAGVRRIPGELVTTLERARELARSLGYPLICKPDSGAGAVATFAIGNDDELQAAFERPIAGNILQPFVTGDIVTYDGLTDREGRIVYVTAHRYDTGIMEVVSGALDGHYWSMRDIPPALDDVGRRAVAAFDVRERFFHLEFFETPSGYVGLEMNLRPPGGFTTDMMNYAADIDVYDLWARGVVGDDLSSFTFERKYHVAHAGRRLSRRYARSHEELVTALGPRLVLFRRLPAELSAMQGDVMYLLRDRDEPAVREAIRLVQEPA